MSKTYIYGSIRSEFPSDADYGKLGEEFFKEYMRVFLRALVLPNTEKRIEKVEGMDLYVIQAGKEIIRYGGIEVKTFGKMSILRYGVAGNDEVTLPFELFSCESGKNVPRQQWSSWGWLRQMFHSQEYNEMRKKEQSPLRAIMPGTLSYLFCESERKDIVQPFLCIAIENFCKTGRKNVSEEGLGDLVDDLKMYASDVLGLDLVKWDIPKADDSFWQKPEIKKHVHENLWNVPLSIVQKHGKPTVTLIDQLPNEKSIREKIDQRYVNQALCRLDKLKKIKDRTLSTENVKREALKTPKKAFAVCSRLPDWITFSDELQRIPEYEQDCEKIKQKIKTDQEWLEVANCFGEENNELEKTQIDIKRNTTRLKTLQDHLEYLKQIKGER